MRSKFRFEKASIAGNYWICPIIQSGIRVIDIFVFKRKMVKVNITLLRKLKMYMYFTNQKIIHVFDLDYSVCKVTKISPCIK